jgi:hypothetical protein
MITKYTREQWASRRVVADGKQDAAIDDLMALFDALRDEKEKQAQKFREGFSRGFEAAWVKVTCDQGKAPFFLSDAEIEHAWEIFNDTARRALGGSND